MCSSTLRVVDQTGKMVPCFKADVVLSLPNIVSTRHSLMDVPLHHHIMQVIQPSLEDIQNAVNTAVQCVVDVGQYVQLWTTPSPASSLSNTPRSNESNHHTYTCT